MAKGYNLWATAQGLGPQDGVSFSLQKLANAFIAQCLTSVHIQPEESDSFREGQKKVITEGHRWFSLLAEVVKSSDSKNLSQSLTLSCVGILNFALKTIVSEDGRPYSAAAIVEMSMRLTPTVVVESPEVFGSIKSLVENDLPMANIILSPCSRYLVSTLFLLRSLPHQEVSFEKAWKSSVDSLSSNTSKPGVWKVLGTLLANECISEMSKSSPALQKLLLEANQRAMDGVSEAWTLFETALAFDCYAEVSAEPLLSQILKYLSSNHEISDSHGRSDRALKALESISKLRSGILSQAKDSHLLITTMLLEITEISDADLASRALSVKAIIDGSGREPGQTNQNSPLDVIQWNLQLEPTSSRILQ